MDTVYCILFGLALGWLLGWLLRSLRPLPRDARVEEELRQQRSAQELELSRLRHELTQAASARAAADAAKSAGEDALEAQRQSQQRFETTAAQVRQNLEAELGGLREKAAQVSAELASVQSQLAAERESVAELRRAQAQSGENAAQLQEQLLGARKRNGELEVEAAFLKERLATERRQLENLQEKFSKEFQAISDRLLLDNSSRFNRESSASLEKLLAPLKETLGEFKTSLDTTRKETVAHSALLKDQISRIGAEAANLSKALKGDVKVLGNWGENMLDQILERSGLQRDVHYRRQQSAKDAEGDQRFLDVIVELPESRNLVIDSKVSLRSYEDLVNCGDDAARLAHLDRHVEALRSHFRGLGAKRYHDIHGINSPDFVLMYVPIEAAFFAAVAHEPGLFAEALEHQVVLITNSTLLATLRTVAHVWRLADQQKHALEIADRGGKLYDKFVGFVEDLQAVRKSLAGAQEACEAATNKLHTGAGNLVRQAEQLKTLGAKATKALSPAMVEQATETSVEPPQLPPPQA
ncbi:MAG: DNA recombination protein RmuC [Verrucomicrobia bacterium]|nr:DNA recombination protein RmuC [Verrucomicrobiota bacterium]